MTGARYEEEELQRIHMEFGVDKTVPFNKLTPAQAERLYLLLEELGEAQQAIGKILRHGYESTHPDDKEVTNKRALEYELGDITAAVHLLSVTHNDLSLETIEESARAKLERVGKYLHHQEKI